MGSFYKVGHRQTEEQVQTNGCLLLSRVLSQLCTMHVCLLEIPQHLRLWPESCAQCVPTVQLELAMTASCTGSGTSTS